MLQLTLAYTQQADRECEIAADLPNRQVLRSTPQALAPFEPPAASSRGPRRALACVRAAGR